MNLKSVTNIFDKMGSSKKIEGILRDLDTRNSYFIGETSALAKVFLTRSIGSRLKTKAVFLTSRKDYISDLFSEWGIETYSFDEFVAGIDDPKKTIALIGPDEAFRKVVAYEEYRNQIIKIIPGDKFDLVGLSDKLVVLGFERVKKAGDNGEFSVKGDVLEIFFDGNKYRIDFFGNNVEKISIFIKGGGSKPEPLQEIEIRPATIHEGERLAIEWLDGCTFFVDGEDGLNTSIFSNFQDDSGKVGEKEMAQMRFLEKFMARQKSIFLEDFSVDEKKGTNLRLLQPKNYAGSLVDFIEFLKRVDRGVDEREVYIFSENEDKLRKIILDNGLNLGEGLFLFKKIISEGLDLSEMGIIIFSDKDIFGSLKKKKRRKVDFSAITNLKKGEYVVHIDHGIGRFVDFGEIEVDGVKREYIFIEYSGEDKIYVPLEQADKITKYIAVGNAAPHLSSLKTNQWVKIRRKVRENAEKVAKELLETQALRVREKSFYYIDDSREQKILEKTFAYRETSDQKKSIEEVLEDMEKRKPMDRLLCGDVGYGKTEVAIRAAARAVISGGQVAVLVPTTILAEQHLQTFTDRLGQFGVKVKSLSRFVKADDQKRVIKECSEGSVDVVIGTHRLFSKDIKFKDLRLIVIDEEQKFGVKHKEKLKKIRAEVDILTMTATPIPRTLYFGLSGLKDISLIQTPPEGRLPIKTIVIKNEDNVIKDAISKEIERGGQVYFVHNRVETIQSFAAKLKKLLPKARFIVAHGQMPEQSLAKIMNDFANGEYDVLVCSTIIESGLDISTVNTLIVDKATNFGLSQLHQLRGRIGRSDRQAYAYFLYTSEDLKGNAQRRLVSISEKGDLGSGYELSLEDLDIRGGGNILGEEQHGSMQMVGVGYYLRLLEEAMDRLQSHKSGSEEILEDIKIDLPISAYIPDGFYEKEEDKIRAYQFLAGVEDEDDLEQFILELKESKKEIGPDVQALLEIVKIRIGSRKAGIKSIIVKNILGMGENKIKKLYIDFDHVLAKDEINKILAVHYDWYLGNTQIKIDLLRLGDEWMKKILMLVKSLKK